jgi:hypothetical protein
MYHDEDGDDLEKDDSLKNKESSPSGTENENSKLNQ